MLYLLFLFSLTPETLSVARVERFEIGLDDTFFQRLDSILMERQFSPNYNSPTTYKTRVKVLQDENNLYFLLNTDFGKDKPSTALSGFNEYYTIYLDPLLSRVSAYYFTIYSSGGRNDGLVLSDGRVYDNSWDGVWESSIRIEKKEGNWQIRALVKIPFKTLRFDRKKKEWGFQVKTYHPKRRETSFWILPDQEEGLKVSKFGILKGVEGKGEGKGIEVYPVGLIKYTERFFPWAGFDFSYKKEASTVNLTFLPDFAEIESDPFTMSLSKYEIYYSERRPFFLTGKEIFEPASGSFYSPIKVFYSRRIGRILRDGSGDVPILFGAKYAGKLSRNEIGILTCLTGDKFGTWDSTFKTSWNVFRIKRYFFENSEVGFLQTAKRDFKERNWDLASSLDGVFRWQRNEIGAQMVFGKSKNSNFALHSGGLLYLTENLFSGFATKYTGERFDISGMGYAPVSPGSKSLTILSGITQSPTTGPISSYSFSVGMKTEKELEDWDWSRKNFLEGYLSFREPTQISYYLYLNLGKEYEEKRGYRTKGLSSNLYFLIKRWEVYCGASYNYTWNYLRDFLAGQVETWGGFFFPLTHRLSINPFFNSWVEYQPNGLHLKTTASGSVYLRYCFTPFASLTFSPSPVLSYEERKWQMERIRFALYFNWEIKPRSHFYLVLNELRSPEEKWEAKERIYATKIKWLFLF